MLIGYKEDEGDTHTTTHTSSNDIEPSSDNVMRLVLAIGKEEMSVKDMMEAVGLKNRFLILVVPYFALATLATQP